MAVSHPSTCMLYGHTGSALSVPNRTGLLPPHKESFVKNLLGPSSAFHEGGPRPFWSVADPQLPHGAQDLTVYTAASGESANQLASTYHDSLVHPSTRPSFPILLRACTCSRCTA